MSFHGQTDAQISFSESENVAIVGSMRNVCHGLHDDVSKSVTNNELADELPTGIGKRVNQVFLACQVCDVTCAGESDYKLHIAGVSHKQNVINRQKAGRHVGETSCDASVAVAGESHATVPVAMATSSNTTCRIADVLDRFTCGPLIGLDFIDEYQHKNPDIEARYYCRCCNAKCDPRTMLPHLTGLRHRSQTLRDTRPDLYCLFRGASNKKSEQSLISEMFARQLEQENGRGRVCVVVEPISKEMTHSGIIKSSHAPSESSNTLPSSGLKRKAKDVMGENAVKRNTLNVSHGKVYHAHYEQGSNQHPNESCKEYPYSSEPSQVDPTYLTGFEQEGALLPTPHTGIIANSDTTEAFVESDAPPVGSMYSDGINQRGPLLPTPHGNTLASNDSTELHDDRCGGALLPTPPVNEMAIHEVTDDSYEDGSGLLPKPHVNEMAIHDATDDSYEDGSALLPTSGAPELVVSNTVEMHSQCFQNDGTFLPYSETVETGITYTNEMSYESSRDWHTMNRGRGTNFRGGQFIQRGRAANMRGGHPSNRGNIPNIRGGHPSNRGSIPNMRGGHPSNRGSIPNMSGGHPSNRGSIPNMRGGHPIHIDSGPNVRGCDPNVWDGYPVNTGHGPANSGVYSGNAGGDCNSRVSNLNNTSDYFGDIGTHPDGTSNVPLTDAYYSGVNPGNRVGYQGNRGGYNNNPSDYLHSSGFTSHDDGDPTTEDSGFKKASSDLQEIQAHHSNTGVVHSEFNNSGVNPTKRIFEYGNRGGDPYVVCTEPSERPYDEPSNRGYDQYCGSAVSYNAAHENTTNQYGHGAMVRERSGTLTKHGTPSQERKPPLPVDSPVKPPLPTGQPPAVKCPLLTSADSGVMELLNNLSNCVVNNEEEAAIALRVSNALTQALLQYRLRNVTTEVRPHKK
ncbi:PREDICTED: uncharacterized protein LOC106805481 isoform X2 [Priapulus caudatus]|uniref:Uncharacterized protein LOC106805481 isoform X2 n=1 Tax=Priapulus caudatus TaxID=37621 RepID=A0ABM1DRJ3_PRICU|nr:PREDICTED: uncharacterized protein LOC106805481 isoform X2 [Priapulus caudatus]